MPRIGKLSQKNGYWYSEAGGTGRYYGKVGTVSHSDAMKCFREHLSKPAVPKTSITVIELVGQYVAWLKENRSERTWYGHHLRLKSWIAANGSVQATSITGNHLEEFTRLLRGRGFATDYVKKHVASVRACFRRGSRAGWLPAGFAPFSSVDSIRVITTPFQESALMSKAEVSSLFQWADSDIRVWNRNEPFKGFEDLLRTYYATGARTSELINLVISDFQPRARQLVLGSHKRSMTLKRDESRQIILDDPTYAIIERLCIGRRATDAIFTRPVHSDQPLVGRGWDRMTLSSRFAVVRRKAAVRDSVTIYSFRHLWISEMLLAGVDLLLVARMAGTSVQMIETVYGHFRNQSFVDAIGRLLTLRQRS